MVSNWQPSGAWIPHDLDQDVIMSLIFVFLTKVACIRSENHMLIAELIFSFMHLESITGRAETMIQKKERGVAHFVFWINVRVLQARFQEPIMLH